MSNYVITQQVLCGAGKIPAVVDNLAFPVAEGSYKVRAGGNGRPDGSAIYGIVLHSYGTQSVSLFSPPPNACDLY